MGKILILESSTEVCSVALSNNGQLIDFLEDKNGQNHARLLTVYIDELLRKNNTAVSEIMAVAVSKGPGSYTGLRIGVSVAKGFCYANQIPLIAVSTLEAMAQEAIRISSDLLHQTEKPKLFCPMMDARRMEVYTCLFDENGKEIEPVSAKIITSTTFENELQKNTVVFFGNGAAKCKKEISSDNAIFIEQIYASATLMCKLAFESYTKKEFVDVAYFEPFYLKDFIATVPKNNVLGK